MDTDIEALALGAAFLGSGGGGAHPAYRLMLARRGLGGIEHRPVTEQDDAVAVGIVGSTDLFVEMLPSGGEVLAAVGELQRALGRRFDAVMPLQIGGMNAPLAWEAACTLGVPLLDADLVGRAVTRLSQISLAADEHVVAAAGGPLGGTVTVRTRGLDRLESSIRALVQSQGGWLLVALALPSRPLARTDVIEGTVQEAVRTGRALLEAGRLARDPAAGSGEDAVAAVLGRAGIEMVGSARIEATLRNHSVRGASGRTVLLTEHATGAALRVEAAGEYLVLLVDGRPAAVSPDVIQLVDRLTLIPVGIEKLRFGEEVLILTRAGHPWWHEDPERLSRVSPQAYGLGAHV